MAETPDDAAGLPDVTTQEAPVLVALADVLALIDAVAAEPGAYPNSGPNRQKVWLSEPSLSRLKGRIAALPQRAAAAPALLDGHDIAWWKATALRHIAGLWTIAHTEGHGIDHDWCRRQASYYLGRVQDGSMVWQMPGAPDLHHIVVPDPALALPRRIQPMPPPPLATLKPGETFTATFEAPDGDASRG